MVRWIKETLLTMEYSLKLLLAGKRTVVLLMSGLLILAGMLACMEEVKEEKSRIPVGIADQSNTELSDMIIRAMQQKDLYEIVIGREEELVEKLKQGELSTVCVFKRNFADNLFKGKTKNLVTMYETEDSSALLFGDVVAGVMMQEVCTAKGYQMLLKYQKKAGMEETVSAEEYREYVEGVLAEGGTAFSFEVTYIDRKNEEAKKPSQSVLYQQAIYAVFALMLGFLSVYAVLPFRQMKHGRMADRIKTLPVRHSAACAGSALAGLFVPFVFGIMFLIGLFWKNRMEFSEILSLLVCTMVYICVIVCLMLFAAYIIKNHTVYQMGMLAMILLFGVFGFISVVDGLLVPEGTAVWVPNGWFVRKMTEIYH
jgi:hypothetical protein